jgi:RNA polymerase sigma-70 factor (ECF subfamily)
MTAGHGEPGQGRREDTGAASGTPSSLLLRLRSPDDGEAWQRLLELYQPTVEGWCLRAGLRGADVADARQEVFAAVARGIAAFRRDRPGDSFCGWLYAITRARVAEFWRRQRAHPPGVGGSSFQERMEQAADPEETIAAEAESREQKELLQRALRLIQGDFTEKTWKAFLGVAVEGRPAADVAAELGLTRGAVYCAKSHVLKRLKLEFEGLL